MGHTHPVTDATFQADVMNSSTPVLVDFWAEWCPPCKAMTPTLEEIAAEMSGKIKIVKLNVDENKNAAAQFGIRGLPTMLLFKNGQLVDQFLGKAPKDVLVD